MSVCPGSVPATCFPTASALGLLLESGTFPMVGEALAREAKGWASRWCSARGST